MMLRGSRGHRSRDTALLDDQNFRRRALKIKEKCDEAAVLLDEYLEEIFSDLEIGVDSISYA